MAIQSAEEFANEWWNAIYTGGWTKGLALITARDDAIRAEEREACAATIEQSNMVGMSGGTVITRELAKEIRARAQSAERAKPRRCSICGLPEDDWMVEGCAGSALHQP